MGEVVEKRQDVLVRVRWNRQLSASLQVQDETGLELALTGLSAGELVAAAEMRPEETRLLQAQMV